MYKKNKRKKNKKQRGWGVGQKEREKKRRKTRYFTCNAAEDHQKRYKLAECIKINLWSCKNCETAQTDLIKIKIKYYGSYGSRHNYYMYQWRNSLNTAEISQKYYTWTNNDDNNKNTMAHVAQWLVLQNAFSPDQLLSTVGSTMGHSTDLCIYCIYGGVALVTWPTVQVPQVPHVQLWFIR